MRERRLLHEPGTSGVYFVTGRIINGLPAIGDTGRKRLLGKAALLADFAGIDLLGMCVMDTHYHLMARVPASAPVGDEELVALCRTVSPALRMRELEKNLASARDDAERARLLQPWRGRRASLPPMIAALQQDFSIWYNSQVGRNGTIWDGRYKSVLIEHEQDPQTAARDGLGPLSCLIAAYADLNPVRAGIASAPEEGDRTSYARAAKGDPLALRGLRLLWGADVGSDKKLLAAHALLMAGGGEAGPFAELLRRRVPAWTRSRALGGRDFVRGLLMNEWEGIRRAREAIPSE